MKISMCIDMMFGNMEFMEKFDKVKACGYNTVEFWKWSNKDIDAVVSALAEKNMNLSVFNLDSSNEQISYDLSRGILNSGRSSEFLSALEESIPVYKKLNASAMIVLIGEHAPYQEENVKKCLEAAKPLLNEYDVNLVIEPLNPVDRIGYCMPYATPVFKLLREVNDSHIKMLYDIYHQNMTGDFSLEEIRENIDLIGHFHVADAPGRHQPGTGNIDYKMILREILKLEYNGYVGLEYRSTVPEEEAVRFLKEAEYV